MSEWKEYKLGDLGTFFGGVTTIKREDYGFGTPFISYKNVYKNSKIDISLIELMNVKKSDILKRNCLFGDIFFTASSETPDEVAMSSVLLDSIDNLTFNGFCKRFRLHNFDILIPQYAPLLTTRLNLTTKSIRSWKTLPKPYLSDGSLISSSPMKTETPINRPAVKWWIVNWVRFRRGGG